MRLVIFVALALLAACREELPKEKIDSLAAIAYLLWGMEEGNENKFFVGSRIERKVTSDGVEYTVFSKAESLPGMRMRVKSPKECIFTIDTREDGKGFVETLDLNKATKFEFGVQGFAFTNLVGPQIYCKGEKCEDEKVILMMEQRGEISLPENQAIAKRKMRAIQFLRNACPGKPF